MTYLISIAASMVLASMTMASDGKPTEGEEKDSTTTTAFPPHPSDETPQKDEENKGEVAQTPPPSSSVDVPKANRQKGTCNLL